jgi:hypothetical protein
MSFLAGLFKRKKSESVILIDVGAESVGGAYAVFTEGELPTLLYTRRFAVEARKGELQEKNVLRSLQVLGDTLIREGAPILIRATGSGRASTVLVSIDAPWQKTSVRIENFDPGESFEFTKDLLAAILEETKSKAPGKLLVDESVIGTLLNGYETSNPFGKKAHRASVVILTSLIDEHVASGVTETLGQLFHTKHVLPIAGSSLRYQALHKAFPHEKDALLLDATGPMTSLALVRNGHFVAITEVPGTDTFEAWAKHVGSELSELAKHYPLPRMIFLLAHEDNANSLRKKLEAAKLGEFWLSDNPPQIISVLVSHLTGLVRQAPSAAPDLLLLLMVVFHAARPKERLY